MRKYYILLAILLVLGGGVLWYRNGHKKAQENQGILLQNKDRQLSEESKKIYLDRIKKAQENLDSLKETDKSYKTQAVNDYIYLAEQSFGLGLLEQSKNYYYKVLNLDLNNEAALVGLAVVYNDAGKYQEALNNLDIAIKINPKNYNLWVQYIGIKKASGVSNERLTEIYNDALKATERYPDILTSFAKFQEEIGNISQAIALWQEVSKVNPSGASLYKQEITRLQKLKK